MSITLRKKVNPTMDCLFISQYDILLNHEKTVGYCWLNLNPTLSQKSGNLGYYIDPSHRGFSYSLFASLELFKIAAQAGRKSLTIYCRKDNAASLHICYHLQQLTHSPAPTCQDNLFIFEIFLLTIPENMEE